LSNLFILIRPVLNLIIEILRLITHLSGTKLGKLIHISPTDWMISFDLW